MSVNEEKKKIILDMISRLGYNKDSYDFMEKHIDDRYLDSYIKDVFKSSENGRLYFNIPDSCKESIDQGWSLFKEMFHDFCYKYKMTYQNFIENKVMIGKNEFKLKKAITQFEIERAEKATRLNTILSSEFFFYSGTFNDIPPDYIGEEGLLGSSVFTFGNPRTTTLFGIIGTGRRAPNLEHHNDVNFYDNPSKSNLRSLAVSSFSYTPRLGLFFCSLSIAQNLENGNYGIYVNWNKKNGATSYKVLTKLRDLSKEEMGLLFGDNTSFKNMVIQNLNGELRIWFVKNNKLFFSPMTINNEKKEISFGPSTETSLSINTSNFGITESNGVFTMRFIYNEQLCTLTSNDGINFEKQQVEAPPREDGLISYCDNFFAISSKEGFSLGYSEDHKLKMGEMERKRIELDISKKLEEVGAITLPKDGGIKLVLSINIEDWLLCSTGEKWTSCLNFESKFHAAHYQGLPGLLGDPNRIMIYFTDGTPKSYNGLVSEKIITRSWVLLDKNDRFNLVKFYPIEIISAEEIANITGFDFKNIEKGFITKNPIKLLEYTYRHESGYNFSGYIYQDRTCFQFDNVDNIYLKYTGEKGYYSLFRELATEKIYMVKAFTFNYESGFNRIKEYGETVKLTDFGVPVAFKMAVCHICGGIAELPFHVGSTGKRYYEYEGKPVCHSCMSKHFIKCMGCDKIEPKIGSKINHYSYGTLCNECNEKYGKKKMEVASCCHCGNNFQQPAGEGAYFFEDRSNIEEIMEDGDKREKYLHYHSLCPTCQERSKMGHPGCSCCGSSADEEAMERWHWYVTPTKRICPICMENGRRPVEKAPEPIGAYVSLQEMADREMGQIVKKQIKRMPSKPISFDEAMAQLEQEVPQMEQTKKMPSPKIHTRIFDEMAAVADQMIPLPTEQIKIPVAMPPSFKKMMEQITIGAIEADHPDEDTLELLKIRMRNYFNKPVKLDFDKYNSYDPGDDSDETPF